MFVVFAVFGIGIKSHRSKSDGERHIELTHTTFFSETFDICGDFGVNSVYLIAIRIGKLVQIYPMGLNNGLMIVGYNLKSCNL